MPVVTLSQFIAMGPGPLGQARRHPCVGAPPIETVSFSRRMRLASADGHALVETVAPSRAPGWTHAVRFAGDIELYFIRHYSSRSLLEALLQASLLRR